MSMYETNGRITLSHADLIATDRDPDDQLAELVALAVASGHTEVRSSTWKHPVSGVVNATITAGTDIVIIADDPPSEWDTKALAALREAGHQPLPVKALFVSPPVAGQDGWFRRRIGLPVGRIGEIDGPFCAPDCQACFEIVLNAEDSERMNPAGGIFANDGAGDDAGARGALRQLVQALTDRRVLSSSQQRNILRFIGL